MLSSMKSDHLGSRVWQSSMPVTVKHLPVKQHPKSAARRVGSHYQSKYIKNFHDLRSEAEMKKLALEVPGTKIVRLFKKRVN